MLNERYEKAYKRPGYSEKAGMRASHQAESWQQELEGILKDYPGIDVKASLQKPQLRALIKAGLSFREAFEAANLDEIREYIAANAEKALMDKLAASSARVRENGIAASKSSPFTVGSEGMSKSDREDIVKRVLRGEEIRL